MRKIIRLDVAEYEFCPVCCAPFKQTRQRRYCSIECKSLVARRESRALRALNKSEYQRERERVVGLSAEERIAHQRELWRGRNQRRKQRREQRAGPRQPAKLNMKHPWHHDGCRTRTEWQSKFPEKMREWWKAQTYRRRAIVMMSGGSWTREDWIRVMREFGYACAYCGTHRKEQRRRYGSDLEADHVVPISGGGTNQIENIVPACKFCNTSKRGHDLIVWAARKGLTPHPLALQRYARQRPPGRTWVLGITGTGSGTDERASSENLAVHFPNFFKAAQ